MGQRGGRADCGFFEGSEATDANCPQNPSGEVCFGHGSCVGYAKVCICDPGYTGRQCQARECEAGNSFFAYGTGADHDSQFFCSNRGACDPDTGDCECMGDFEGESCNVLACPANSATGDECGSHGACTSLEGLATEFGQSYPSSNWDATQIRGCFCESDIYVGPFTGQTSDASGFVCALA